MSTQPSALSFDPSTFVEGGGIINDVDVTWSNTRIAHTKQEYNDKVDGQPHTAIHADLVYTDRDGKQAIATQFWVIGKAIDFVPNSDGTAAISLHGKGIHSGSNAAMIIKSLLDNGCPIERVNAFAADVRTFNGFFCHMFRKPETRDFQEKADDKKAKVNKRNEGPLVVTKVHRWPWDAQPAGGVAAFKPNGVAGTATPAPTAGGSGDAVAQERAMALIQSIMTGNPGINRQGFNIAVFRGAVMLPIPEPEKGAVRALAQSRAFQDSLGLAFPGE